MWESEGGDLELELASQLQWTFGQSVTKKDLVNETKEDGMVGLILAALKQIRKDNCRLQHLKNIIQEFMEAMYKCIED